MNRSAGVTIAAVFSLLGSLLFLLMGFLLVVVAVFSKAVVSSSTPPGGAAMMFVSAAFMTLPGIWGVSTSIGLFRLKRWACTSILIFGALLTFFGLVTPLGLLAVRFPTPPNQDPAIFNSVRLGMSAFYLCLAGVGVWWLIYFTRPSVKEQFTGAVTTVSSSGRPASITVIAILLLLGSAFMLLSTLMHLPALLFNHVFTGWAATIVYLAYTAVCLYLGIGLLRLNPRARVAALAYSVFGIVVGICTYTLPGWQQRMTSVSYALPRMLRAESPTPMPMINPWFMVSFVIIFMGAQIYFLVARKHAFEKSGAQNRIESSL